MGTLLETPAEPSKAANRPKSITVEIVFKFKSNN